MTSIRVASWNVQRGGKIESIAAALASEAADLALLQEVDVGMARSGNVHVPRGIAEALEARGVLYGIEFEEGGLGNAAERAELGTGAANLRGLHANAVVGVTVPLPNLSHRIELSEGREWSKSEDQPRAGGRHALAVLVAGVYFVTAHLEARTSADKRAGQMARLVAGLKKLGAKRCVVGGDLNCKEGDDEPLFDVAAAAGLRRDGANLDGGRYLGRRLDWFLVRGVEIGDPHTIDGSAASDHDLVTLAVELPK